jgi:hypothetical protein
VVVIVRPLRVVQPYGDGVPADLSFQVRGSTGGDDPPMVDDGDGVGEGIGFFEVLGGQQDGDAVGGQIADHLPQLVALAWVQADRGLVEEGHLGVADQARGQVEAAAHASGVAGYRPSRRVRQAEPGQQLACPLCGVASGRSRSCPIMTRFASPVSSSSTLVCWPDSAIRRRTCAGWRTTSKPNRLASFSASNP